MKTYSTTPGTERSVAVVCNLCGDGETVRHLSDVTYRFVRCRKCSLVYQNPQPIFEDLKRRYGPDYFSYERGNEQNFFELMLLGMGDVGFAFLQVTGRLFLDIGCATGLLLQHMEGLGWDVRGVDLTPESAAFARRERGLDVFTGTLEEAGFPSESFSVVHFSHLLEHVPDPAAILREVNRILTPGGYALITTPNVRGLQARLFGTDWRSAIPDHLFLFSKRTLAQYLRAAELRILKIQTWGGLAKGAAPVWLKRPADVLAKLFGFGDVMLFLARKPLRELPADRIES